MLEDLRDLGHAIGKKAHEYRRKCDEEDRALADEAMRFARRVENGGKLIHQRDDGDGNPGEPPFSSFKNGEEVFLAPENEKENG